MNAYFAACRSLIDDYLSRAARDAVMPSSLRPAIEEALRSSGKRVRGTLTMSVAEAFGIKREKVVASASAIEMIHTCSLILDDLPAMDDAELRRGKPALHRQHGEDLAILAAVALLNHAYGLIGNDHAELKPRRWTLAQILDRLVHAVGWNGAIGGEAVDLHSASTTLDFKTLEYIHSRKTGALFVASASIGAMLANAPRTGLSAIDAYAKNLGLAFQITDDILDVTSTPEVLGKDVQKDTERLTFVKLAGLEGARQLNEELIATSIEAIAPLGRSGTHLRELAQMVRDRVR